MRPARSTLIRRRLKLLMCAALLSHSTTGTARELQFALVPRADVETRLGQFGGQNRERQATLKRMFVDAGCEEHLSEQRVGLRPPNVVCVLPGSSGRVIIVGAHFDKVPAGDGVADNWSGASLLPSLYQSIKIEPRQHTYIFIGFTDEESGLVGSNFYARRMTREQVNATDAMVNLDTLGLDSTNVWLSRSSPELVGALAHVAETIGSPIAASNFERVGSSDSESFARRKVPRITVHSLNLQNYRAGILHSRKDKLSVMQLDAYYETYRLLVVYLVFLDGFFNATAISTPPARPAG
jgi:putative aminopeptidase FrvX